MGELFGQIEKWLDIVQFEIREIHSVATQGFTKPLHCKLSNEKNYYVKGKRATAVGMIRIDKRLLNTVTTIKSEFKDGKLSLDNITTKPVPKQDNAKLLKNSTVTT